MGSTFKVLNTAIALETGAADINHRFDVGNQCGSRALPSPITNRATDRLMYLKLWSIRQERRPYR